VRGSIRIRVSGSNIAGTRCVLHRLKLVSPRIVFPLMMADLGNAAPSQELLVIRRDQPTAKRRLIPCWSLIPHFGPDKRAPDQREGTTPRRACRRYQLNFKRECPRRRRRMTVAFKRRVPECWLPPRDGIRVRSDSPTDPTAESCPIPRPLRMLNGTKITTRSQCNQHRTELQSLEEFYLFGHAPSSASV